MHKFGYGVVKNDATAVGWYRKSADQGHPMAQGNLGHMYFRGYGVDKDHVEAEE